MDNADHLKVVMKFSFITLCTGLPGLVLDKVAGGKTSPWVAIFWAGLTRGCQDLVLNPIIGMKSNQFPQT